jgi:hypothetical protein
MILAGTLMTKDSELIELSLLFSRFLTGPNHL